MNGRLRKLLRITAAAVLVFSLGNLLFYLYDDYHSRKTEDQLRELKDQAELEIPDVLPEYSSIYNENSDTIGWLKIDGTGIDNVVMYAPDEIEKYLHADFYGNYSYRGCLYVDEYCDILRSDNLIIYGHNMKDGSMFGSLMNYADEGFYEKHKYISFDTIYEKQTYEVVAAIKTAIPAAGEECFRYYEYTGSDDVKMFNEYVEFIEENRLYPTDAKLHEGDSILTLSTCAYHADDGRFIVVARKI
ncbi:MAG: class B sortase [Oscillospiraceae bacterium]|nr:class B sortase [Oscillospiraceae bacterium]